MSSLSRRQIIVWALTGFIILAIGAGYLRSHLAPAGRSAATAITIAARTGAARGPLKIHVVGAVARPGLYEALPGSRVADAVGLAGGPTPDADLSQINLAAKLADGQQIAVPQKRLPGAAASGAGAAGGGASPGNPVNLNSATAAQLDNLDGVGPKTAQKIIEYREAHGGFRSIDELLEVPGIGQAKLDQIKGDLTL